MRQVNRRQKPTKHIRAQRTPGVRKPLSVAKARTYFRRKDHPESPVIFWKKEDKPHR